MTRAPLSVHILDTSKGKPASGVEISLFKIDGTGLNHFISTGFTAEGGRCDSFLKREDYTSGLYKLRFEIEKYFARDEISTLYPYVEVTFQCDSSEEYYHIPLLITPYGYSTYKGS